MGSSENTSRADVIKILAAITKRFALLDVKPKHLTDCNDSALGRSLNRKLIFSTLSAKLE